MSKRDIPINDDSDSQQENADQQGEAKKESDSSVVNSNRAASAYQQQAGQEKEEGNQPPSEKPETEPEEQPEEKQAEEAEPTPIEKEPEADQGAMITELKDRLMRQAAEFDNFRKRTQRERTEIVGRAAARLVEDMLPVLDNFKLAFQQEGLDPEDPFYKGMELVYKQFQETLKRHGVEPIQADGEQFNPEVHEALMSEPTDEYPEDTVTQVLQDGYTLNGRVLRPARVKVAKPAE